MSGIQHALQACLAGQRDWRRATIAGNAVSNQKYGYCTGWAGSGDFHQIYGAFAPSTYGGHNIVQAGIDQATGSDNFRLCLDGSNLLSTFFNGIEVGLSNGQSRILLASAATSYLNASTVGVNMWVWNVATGFIWGAADVGKVLAVSIF